MRKKELLSIIAAVITIFVFITGIPSIRAFYHSSNSSSESINDKKEQVNNAILKSEERPPNKLVKGTGNVHSAFWTNEDLNGFSFVMSRSTLGEAGDFCVLPWDHVMQIMVTGEGGVLNLGPVDFDSLDQVPEMKKSMFSCNYLRHVKLHVGNVYALRLNQGYYAKIIITDHQGEFTDNRTSFRYVLQQNGTFFFR